MHYRKDNLFYHNLSIAIIMLLTAATIRLSAQEFVPMPVVEYNRDFVINQVYLLIEGDTMPGALRSFLAIKNGSSFSSYENLVEALENEKQYLIDRKYYTKVEYLLEGNEENGYIVTFLVEEETPFIPNLLPAFDKYSRRKQGYEGFYDNAFGTMTDWDISMYAKLNSSGVGDWQISESMRKLRIGDNIYSINISQTHDQIYFEEYGEVLGNYSVDVTRAGISTEYAITNHLFYELEPGVALRYNYSDHSTTQRYEETPFECSYAQSISREYIDWIGNNRDGSKLKLFSDFVFAQTLDHIASWEYTFLLGTSASVYNVPWRYISLYTDITVDYSFFTDLPMKGNMLRGITDERVYGNKGFYIRNTLGLDLLRVPDYVNFQLHPFLDIGTASSQGNSFHTLYMGNGIDVVFFLDFASDFSIRGSVGWDLVELLTNQKFRMELTLQTGLAY